MSIFETKIFDFFNKLSDRVGEFITSVECTPIKFNGNIFITGLKRNYKNGIPTIEFHLKELKESKNGKVSNVQPKDNGEITINATLFNDDVSKMAIQDVMARYNSLNEFEILKMAYKLTIEEDNCAIREEVVLYENNHEASNGALKKRLSSKYFRSKIIHFKKDNNITVEEKKYTDEELAEL